MRASWVIVLVAACGGGGVKDIKDTPPPPAPEATCHSAGTKLIELVVAGHDPVPPDDAVNRLIALVEKRCATDTWKPEARACFSKVKTVDDANDCSQTLTEPQLANLSKDMAPPGETPPGGGAATGGAPEGAPPGGTRGPVPKDGADPCDGGE